MKNNIVFFKKIICMAFVLAGLFGTRDARADTVAFLVDYELWADVLGKHVNAQGRFDYDGLMKDRSNFDRFVSQLENADLSQLNDTEKKAFWINAYNALTVKVILDHYPVNSIREIDFGLVENVSRQAAGGKKSLGDIEHKILQPLGDPRIHFAINSASVGCPKLPNKPFYPQTLDEQLEEAARRFINDPEKVRIDRKNNVLYHSAIFSWHKKDFLGNSPDLGAYIQQYMNDADKAYIQAHQPELKKLDYDWNLNR